jgi:hypothetical protein
MAGNGVPLALITLVFRLSRARVASSLAPITVNGVRYRVLRLNNRAGGPRFVLGDEHGKLFSLLPDYARTTFYAEPLDPDGCNPLREIEFQEGELGLIWVR